MRKLFSLYVVANGAISSVFVKNKKIKQIGTQTDEVAQLIKD